MKFVKGVSVFLVLCFAAYGAFTLFKNLTKPPQIDISENDRSYLEDLGIHVHDSRAEDSGLSPLFGDMEGIEPVGAGSGAASSSPPSFLLTPTTTSANLPFTETAPRVAVVVPELPVVPESTPAVPDPFSSSPLEAPLYEAPPFGAAPLEISPTKEVQMVPATESPPPQEDGWDGPASDISTTPRSPESILPLVSIPPIPNTSESTPPFAVETSPVVAKIAYAPIPEPVRAIEREKESNVILVNAREEDFSSSVAVPVVAPPEQVQHYTQTSARQPFKFEPIKPGASSNAPMIVFAPPKQTGADQEPVRVAVKPLGTPRLIDRTDTLPAPQSAVSPASQRVASPPIEQSAIPETVEGFIRIQRQHAESNNPDKIRNAFVLLSQLYEHEQLGEAERTLMQPILDALALKVIYAGNTHILEPPHRVMPGETVESIARTFLLPPALLRRINGLTSSQEPPVGAALKVVHGQFDARISIKRKELTLLLGGLYAGRFPFTLSNANVSVQRGDYFISNKTPGVMTMNNGWTLATAHVKGATLIFADHVAHEMFDILSEQSVIVLE